MGAWVASDPCLAAKLTQTARSAVPRNGPSQMDRWSFLVRPLCPHPERPFAAIQTTRRGVPQKYGFHRPIISLMGGQPGGGGLVVPI